MSGYLLDLFVQRERVQALKAMVKSWVVFVLYLLGPLMISLFVVYKCLEVVKWLNAKTLLITRPSDLFFGIALIECSFTIKTRIIIIILRHKKIFMAELIDQCVDKVVVLSLVSLRLPI